MNRTALAGIAGAVVLVAFAGGLGLAWAQDGGSGHMDGGHMGMGGNHGMMSMAMDASAMDTHMRGVMGEEAYEAMLAAMPAGGHDAMLEAMSDNCPGS